MNYTIGDGLVALALAAGIVGYLYVTHRTRQKRIDHSIWVSPLPLVFWGVGLLAFHFLKRKPGR